MDSAAAPSPDPAPAPALDIATLLARINQRITLLRAWLSHDHGDAPYWWARHITAPQAQSERAILRRIADLLHVERATARGRVHGTQFADLAAQRAWLDVYQYRSCGTAARLARVPNHATLALLRGGHLPL